MKRLLLILALAMGGLLVAGEAQAQPGVRVFRPRYRVYRPRVYAPPVFVGPRVVGPPVVVGPRVVAPPVFVAPRRTVYSVGPVYGGWWGPGPSPYFYGGPRVFVGW